MKKYSVKFAILSILTILCFAGCTAVTNFDSKIMNQEVKPVETLKNGTVSVKMFIPDYYTLTESRAIAPQTKYARLKYYTDDEWSTIETLEIKEEDLSDIEGAEDVGLPGKIWKATFVLGLGTYSEGKLAIDLLDGDQNVITSGVNNADVEIKENEKPSCSFFTVPQEVSSTGSLRLNEMKFFKINGFNSGDTVKVLIAELAGAEVIRFNADGTFGGVVTTDFVADKEFVVTDDTAGSYYGVWAKKTAVDSYEVEFCNAKYFISGLYIEDFNTFDESVWSYGGDTEVTPVVPTIGAYEYAGTNAIKMPCNEGKNIENGNYVNVGDDSFLERTVYLEENAVVSFTFFPNANYVNGTDRTEFAFYIDGEEKKTWQGVGGFINAAFDLPKGQHTLKWVSRYTRSNYYLYEDMAFYLDKVSISNANKTVVELGYTEDFNSLDINSAWSFVGTEEISPVTVKIGDYEYTGVNALKMPCVNNSSYLERTVYLEENAVVSFTFYPYGLKSTLEFYIDDEKKCSWTKNSGIARTVSFNLSAGEHTLKWMAPASNYSNQIIYLDKVSIVADEVDSVVIYPRGVQTVVVGETITYTAKAYRVDGSEITEKTVTKEFTAITEGEDSFDMEIDGKTVTATVKVVSADYLTKPLVYIGNTYNGIDSSTMSGSTKNVNLNSSFQQIKDISKLEVSYPTGNTFSADAFFPLKLKVNNPEMYQFMAIIISNGTNTEHYFYRGTGEDGEINTRIWLRWGAGEYTVKLYDLSSVKWNYKNVGGTSADGNVTYQGDNVVAAGYYYAEGNDYPAVTFTVNNTCDEDGTWLYPSSVVQADDINIMNKAADITYGLETAYDKAKAIHDWIVLNHFYDNDSLAGARKRQDAVAVMEYGMAVCEGYANLSAALIRNCGIEVKYISSSSMVHGWNHVNVGTAYNPDWRLLDCTWDDPDVSSIIGEDDGGPFYVEYRNFLLTDHNGGGHTASDQEISIGRSISISRGHDDGTESIAY